jgi:hypothetical protein
MKDIIIVGEDQVTLQVIKRLLGEICPESFSIVREDPVRGSEVKKLTPKYNVLAESIPVILLADLDQEPCPVTAQAEWLNNIQKNPDFMFRFAIDEAESWLLADRPGFAAFLGISETRIPEPTPARTREPHNLEIRPPYKSSLFMMRELATFSPNQELKHQLTPLDLRSKSSEYNSALLPFISQFWNIQAAIQNSYSLQKMVRRLGEWRIQFQS